MRLWRVWRTSFQALKAAQAKVTKLEGDIAATASASATCHAKLDHVVKSSTVLSVVGDVLEAAWSPVAAA